MRRGYLTPEEYARLVNEQRARTQGVPAPMKPGPSAPAQRGRPLTVAQLERVAHWIAEQHKGPGLFLPVRTVNSLNVRGRNEKRDRMRRAKEQRELACGQVLALPAHLRQPPLMVRLTRYGPRRMDDEGMIASLKHVRDGIAKAVGVDDGDTTAIRFDYAEQVISPPHCFGVRIQFFDMDGG